MGSSVIVKALTCLCFLAQTTISMPSFDHGIFDDVSTLQLGGALKPRSFPFEIRGVVGGRKKRYIVERDDNDACCREKPICKPTIGEIIKDCKCQKCPTGIPALDGRSCQPDCPTGQEKNDQGGCCPAGQKAKITGDGCEAKQSENDKKGNCPGDTVLDPKQGWDPKIENTKCQIDDEKDCKKPNLPATRPEGSENDSSLRVACGKPNADESKRPKCDPKSQYVHVFVDSDNNAIESCKQTKKYFDRKREKPTNSDIRSKIKDTWTKRKPDYDKKEKERQESLEKLKKLKEEHDKQVAENDKIKDANDKKKERQGKCSTVISLLMGAVASEAAKQKRDDEHPYDWTTDYFDEEFVSSDDRLADWPDDIDVEKISPDVDTDKWLKKWDEYLDDQRRQTNQCNFVGKRSLDRRCGMKRSLEDWYGNVDADGDFDFGIRQANTSSSFQRNVDILARADMSPRDIEELEKRSFFLALFIALAQFATRTATQVVARATAVVASHSARLANLVKAPDRLFQIALKGQGTKAGQTGMGNARQAIMKDSARWKKCLKDGIPL